MSGTCYRNMVGTVLMFVTKQTKSCIQDDDDDDDDDD
jgi:hypothetical protein